VGDDPDAPRLAAIARPAYQWRWSTRRMRPNIVVFWGDHIGITNLSCYSDGLMG
jgi:hypothetical protein